jgi:SAM-dependent methyltransferase
MPGACDLGIAPPGVYEAVLQTLRPVAGAKVLDVPCASGGFARQLALEGAFCVAADRVPARGCARVVAADMNAPLPFASGTFDIITCLEGVEHAQNPFQLVREFHRLLRSQGRLVLSTPNIHNLRSRIKFLLRGTLFWFDPREVTGVGHITVLPYFILKHMLQEAGFRDVSVQWNRRVMPFVPGPVVRMIQWLGSSRPDAERELNSPVLLNGEGLIVQARKPQVSA